MLRCLATVMFALSLFGCGYHFPNGSVELPGGVKSLNIPFFANKSYRSNLETIIHRSVIDEFQNMRGFKVLTNAEADATISATIVSYSKSAVSYSAADKVSDYRVTVIMDAVLRQNGTNKVLWKGTVTQWQDFPVNTSIAVQQSSEDAAIQELAQKAAQQLFIKINEDF